MKRIRYFNILILAPAMITLSVADWATGQTFWQAGTSNWNTAANWTLGVPNAGSGTAFDAVIGNGGTAQLLAPPNGSVRRLRVGRTGGTGGHLIVDATTLTVTENFHVNETSGGAASVTVRNGSTVNSPSTIIGYSSAHSSSALITGTGTNFNAATQFVVGNTGAGTASLTMQSGAALSTGSFIVASGAGSTGVVTLSGGTLTSNGDESIGSMGTGTVNQTGGTNAIAGAGRDFYIGYNSGATGTYTISGGTLTINDQLFVGGFGTGTINIQNTGTVHVGTTLQFFTGGAINMTGGTLRFNGAGSIDVMNYAAGTIQLGGARTIGSDGTINTLFGLSANIPANKGLTVEGYTTISNSSFTNVNGGRLTSQSTLQVGGSTDGYLQIINGGTVVSQSAFIGPNSAGPTATVWVSGPGSSWTVTNTLRVGYPSFGTLNVENQGLVHTDFLATDFGTLNLNGGTVRFNTYGSLNGFNYISGTVQLGGNRTIGAESAISLLYGGLPTILAGKGLTIEQTATLQTTLTVDGGTFTAGQIVNGHNLQLLRGTLNITNQAVTIGSGGPFGSSLDVNEDVTVNVTLGVTNQGLVTGDGLLGGRLVNAASGELRTEPGRSLKLTGANNTNAGQINLYGGMLDFTQNLTNNAGGFISGNGTLRVVTGLTNSGTMNFSGLANVVGDVTNSATGKVISSGGGPTTFHDDVANQTGSEIRTSNGSFTVFFGAVSGTTNFTGTGTVNFEGDLKPGSSPAQLNFAGNVGFGPSATLEVELGGTAAGTQHDKLNVAGNLALNGALEVSLINGFNPSAGQSFNILDWGSLAGTFSSISLPTLAGLAWNTAQLYATGVLSVAAAAGLTGDYNNNGYVDAADYVVWRRFAGTTTAFPNDPHGGTIGSLQFNTSRHNFGNTAGSGSGAASFNANVPEPASLALVALAAISALAIPRSWVAAKNRG